MANLNYGIHFAPKPEQWLTQSTQGWLKMFAPKLTPTAETVAEAKHLLTLPETEQYTYWLQTLASWKLRHNSTPRGLKLAFRNWQKYVTEVASTPLALEV
jgi:hypothetical protein